MVKLIRIDEKHSAFIIDGDITLPPEFSIYIQGMSIRYKIPSNGIRGNQILVKSNLFSLERSILNSGDKIEFQICYSNSEIFYSEELLLAPSYFKNFIDLSTPEFFPPFQYNLYNKPKRLAILTHVYNEDYFLKIFINYYSKIVPLIDIYIIDHGSDFIDKKKYFEMGCQIISIPRSDVDHLNIKKYVEYFQRFLLTQYRWVISVDVDELLICKNGIKEFHDFLDQNKSPCIIKPYMGVNLIQHPQKETDLKDIENISMHRSYYKFAKSFDKPVLASAPTTWGLGFHYSLNDNLIKTSDLFLLVHLAHISINEKLIRNIRWNKNKQSDGDAIHVAQRRLDSRSEIENEHKEMLLGNDLHDFKSIMKGLF
jgi:hypothetical protein